ncbi:VacJ family lipoprotein [Marinomonas pontica]|uniref:MlaA family lipoprotein n=1 Tax=Marinomonas pontica TaxID=264739 RepID=UPI002242F6F5|nr:VacJ family lipoprotein [Marinomonas pontica]MCW8357100.1 VacJ family lipoprotein [Marinomonas pontica]
MLKVMATWLLSMSFLFSQSVFAATEEDPWEGFNRSMFAFNDTIDGAVLKPVAQGYKAITPTPVQKGVSNFFSNLGEISNIANNLLQGKWDGTASSTFRFLINSTAGWFGIFDVASEMGLKKYDEDFGQTLGYWGYRLALTWSCRSLARPQYGMVLLLLWNTLTWMKRGFLDLNSDEELGLLGLKVIDTRARYLNAEGMIVGDRYSFIRDIYLQNRAYEVYDGNVPSKPVAQDANQGDDSWAEDSWGEEADSGSSWGEEADY